jgi:hypothetical protein
MQRLRRVDFTKNCRYCAKIVGFNDDYVTRGTGVRIPFDIDTGYRHTCEPDEEWQISSMIQKVADLNKELTSCQLRLVREPEARVDHE